MSKKKTAPSLDHLFSNKGDDRPEAIALLKSLKAALPDLEKLLEEVNDHWCYEDGVYRFYHQSLKVWYLQESVKGIVARLQALAPDKPLNSWFMKIVADGTAKQFEMSDNQRWLEAARPIVEAFFHAKYFLEMAVRYGKELGDTPPSMLPSGWAAFLYLYNMR